MDVVNAIRAGDMRELDKCLRKPGRCVNDTIMHGRCPLHHAVACNMRPVVEFLVEQKMADVNVVDEHDSTPLMIAISKNNAILVKYLIEMGADPTGRDSDDRTYDELTDNKLILKYLEEAKRTQQKCC